MHYRHRGRVYDKDIPAVGGEGVSVLSCPSERGPMQVVALSEKGDNRGCPVLETNDPRVFLFGEESARRLHAALGRWLQEVSD